MTAPAPASPSSAARRSAWRELAAALVDAAWLPLRLFDYWIEEPQRKAAIRADLVSPAPRPVEPPDTVLDGLPQRSLRIVISSAEASGDIHAANLARALRERLAALGRPAPQLIGCGGPRLAAAEVPIAIDTVAKATMGLGGALRALPYYVDLVAGVADVFREQPIDLFLPVDSPALHVPLARIARRGGAKVVHFVTPQYWGWAPWRVARYRGAVDLALSILPFEPAWFERHGVRSEYVGHPLLDALADVPATRPDPASRTLVLLPGSRASVIERNLPWMLALVAEVRPALGEAEVVVVQETDEHRARIEEHLAAAPFARLVCGDLHGWLARARAALSVSGTILIDLLHHRLPAVVVYRIESRVDAWMYRHLLTPPWFASINLLAGAPLLPEFCFQGDGPRAQVGQALERCYNDGAWRAACAAGLGRAARRLGPPGAARRAAAHALAALSGETRPPLIAPASHAPSRSSCS